MLLVVEEVTAEELLLMFVALLPDHGSQLLVLEDGHRFVDLSLIRSNVENRLKRLYNYHHSHILVGGETLVRVGILHLQRPTTHVEDLVSKGVESDMAVTTFVFADALFCELRFNIIVAI